MSRRYNRSVSSLPLAFDTSPEIERMQIESWRRMSSVQKAELVTGLTSAAIEMARSGIRHRHPGESQETQHRRLAEILLGTALARQAFPDLTRTS